MKTVYVVRVDNYFPELCELTFPWISRYADRIGARMEVIEDRRFPEFPPTYEKLQIYERGKSNDWNILIDADMLVGPDFPDATQITPIDRIGLFMQYDASLLFEADQYFARDGRRFGIVSNLLAVHKTCHDFWTPLDYGFQEAKNRTKRVHIVDEFCLSRNVARFGLKTAGLCAPDEFMVAPLILDPEKIPDTQILHLDVSNNPKQIVLKVAEGWAKRQSIHL